MVTKVIVILLICFKLDYTTSLPDIIRIGEDFSRTSNNKKIFYEEENPFFMQHRVTRKSVFEDSRSRWEAQILFAARMNAKKLIFMRLALDCWYNFFRQITLCSATWFLHFLLLPKFRWQAAETIFSLALFSATRGKVFFYYEIISHKNGDLVEILIRSGWALMLCFCDALKIRWPGFGAGESRLKFAPLLRKNPLPLRELTFNV